MGWNQLRARLSSFNLAYCLVLRPAECGSLPLCGVGPRPVGRSRARRHSRGYPGCPAVRIRVGLHAGERSAPAIAEEPRGGERRSQGSPKATSLANSPLTPPGASRNRAGTLPRHSCRGAALGPREMGYPALRILLQVATHLPPDRANSPAVSSHAPPRGQLLSVKRLQKSISVPPLRRVVSTRPQPRL